MSVFFSIVVVSYNAGEAMKHTIDSVLEQTFDDYEIIVKDGLSTDNTLNFIPDSSKIRVYSEKDCGIYDAMNQAINYCNGKYIVFINCGDTLYSNNVLSVVYSYALRVQSDNNVIYGDLYKLGVVMNQMRKVTARKLYRTTLCHQTLFYSKDIFEKNGSYDINYKICADYEHILRMFRNGVSFVYCDCIIVNYEGGGFSEKKENINLMKEEHRTIYEKYFSLFEIFVNKVLLSLLCGKIASAIRGKCSNKYFQKSYRKLVNFLVKKGLV